MKLAKLVLASMLMTSCAYASGLYEENIYPSQWKPFIEAQGGVSMLNDNADRGSVASVRGGASNGSWDLSYGYLRNYSEINGDKLLSGDLVLHTLSLEAYRTIPIINGIITKIGVGAGYTVPNPDNGSETLDSGVSGLFSGILECPLTSNLSIGITAKYFVFNTESHRTTRTTETDTVLSGGIPIGTVEVENEAHSDNSINMNQLMLTAGLKYSF